MQQTIRDLRESLSNQIQLINALKKAREVVRINETITRNERKKLGAGLTTLFELLTYEEDADFFPG